MEIKEILGKCDHTCLSKTATWEEIKRTVEDGITYGVASVCIPPCFVERAARFACGRVAICTVVGFPNGYSTTAAKVAETAELIALGADEIDVVVNISKLKDRDLGYIVSEISSLKKVCGDKVLKIIVETCLLSRAEIIVMCDLVVRGGADFIKTSTGFDSAGAKIEDVEAMREFLRGRAKIKAAGGIRTVADAEACIGAGADRIGTSGIVKAVKQL